MDTNALRAQIESDPRVQQAAAANGGYLPPMELRKLYPQAPPDWGYKGPGDHSRGWRSGPAGVVDSMDWGDKLVGTGAGIIGGYGVGTILNDVMGGGGQTPDPGTGTPAPTGTPETQSLLSKIFSPQNAVQLAGLIPAITSLVKGNTSGPFGSGPEADALTGEVRDSIAAQRRRFDATEPAFQTAQNMALGMAPTRYRSGPFGG